MHKPHRWMSSSIRLLGVLVGLHAAAVQAARYTEPRLFRPDEVLVQYDSDITAVQAKSGYAATGMQVERTLLDGRTHLLRLPSFTDIEGARTVLAARPGVLHVEPNYLRQRRIELPDDPLFSQQWGLYSTGQRNFVCDRDNSPCSSRDELASIPGADMNLLAAWDPAGDGSFPRTGSRSVVVAVIDDAFDLTHPDLAANFIAGRDLVDKDNDPSPDRDGLLDHGTLVAGSLGAIGNNGTGIAGVAWNVSMMPLKIGRINQGAVELSEDAILDAYDYARTHGAQIINASYGGPSFSAIEKSKIEALASAGILFVTSAGNFNSNLDYSVAAYPANYDVSNVVAVAATNRQDNVASFSQFGPLSTDVAAPGLQIVTTSLGGGYVTGDSCGTGPCGVNGTSFSAPHVAGIAALIKSVHPDADYREIRARLIEGAEAGVDGGDVAELTAGGRVDAANSLELAPRPALILRSVKLIDDGNQRLDPGETLDIEIEVANLWLAAADASAELIAPGGIEVLSAAQPLGTLAQDGSAKVRFSVRVTNSVASPYQDLPFAVRLRANGGAYQAQRPFRLELAELSLGTPVNETLSKGLHDEFHTYHLDLAAPLPRNAKLVIRSSAAQDIDVLVKYGRPAQYDIDLGAPPEDDPTFFTDADKVGGGEDGNETVTIDNPRAGTYYVTVLNYALADSLPYTLEARLESGGGSGGGGVDPRLSAVLLLFALARRGRGMRAIRGPSPEGLPDTKKA
ncbi:S8 family serine peptidase [Fontimonas sp. SYSU GA230001]|uniref:S8 family serine peptidase n=1 Tax=Fontimonas sp. SYSU GA230001 TaxID=3142450 RepID=UPI0032B54473